MTFKSNFYFVIYIILFKKFQSILGYISLKLRNAERHNISFKSLKKTFAANVLSLLLGDGSWKIGNLGGNFKFPISKLPEKLLRFALQLSSMY